MGYGLSAGTYTICAPNPQTRTSQLLPLAPVKKTKSEIGVKNDRFLPFFELIYFCNAERVGALTYGVAMATLGHYTYQTTGAYRLWFLP